ncbi:MAG: aspartate dehydrogenase domain-containing protein [Peptoniphilus sp.]|nr:aspartate dehydrogenase domain-containing protein [Peptoniphilus sp.]MDY3118713.1 aspartate dehydrogenase domain-containing protein [Peptoniphilus sp.]
MKNIAVIGYGALGHILVDALLNTLNEDYCLKGIFDQAFKDKALSIQEQTIPLYKDFESLLMDDTDIVVEIAGVGAVKEYIVALLEKGKDVVITSVGALADGELYERIERTAKKSSRKVHITSGAIGGFDLMGTLTLMGGVYAEIQSTKAPKSLNGAPYLQGKDLPSNKKTVAFEGSATEAIQGFPKNTNVAVATGINTVGADATKVRILSDPESVGNTHRVTVENDKAKAVVEITSKPDPNNPKSSVTAAWSVAALLKNLASPIQFF